ncbi:MAG: homoserine kinase [Saprospiraceae bacterium]|nr:MAG: homoserine kinase [Saprospiraceae bacterium]
MNSIKVFAPASVANVAVGYDILGFALEKPGDEVIVRFSDQIGFRITEISGANGKLPLEVAKNTAGVAALRLLEHLGKTDLGIEMQIHKKMPFGSGLGSSAASAAAGVFAVNELLGGPLTKLELLPFAVAGEQVADGAYHADNVGPSLLGGMLFIRNNDALDVHQLPVPEDLYAAVVYPEVEVLTKDAREVLSDTVSLKNHIEQTGNLGGLLIGFFECDYELIGRSLRDVIIEPQRAKLIPHFAEVKAAALKHGALGCSISGAGPSIFALCKGEVLANNIGAAMQQIFNNQQINNQLFVSPINRDGAIKL